MLRQIHRHDFYEVMWVTSPGTFQCDFQTCVVPAGSLLFVRPGQLHTWLEDDVRVDVLGFKLELLEAAHLPPELVTRHPVFAPDARGLVSLPANLHDEVQRVFQRLQGLRQAQDGLAAAYLQVLLAEVQPFMPAPAGGSSLVQEFLRDVESQFQQRWTVKRHAAALNVTPAHLIRVVHMQTGFTPGELIHQRLHLEARRLLTFDDTPISQLAYTLGFATPSQFGTWFRKQQGMSPQQFRLHINN